MLSKKDHHLLADAENQFGLNSKQRETIIAVWEKEEIPKGAAFKALMGRVMGFLLIPIVITLLILGYIHDLKPLINVAGVFSLLFGSVGIILFLLMIMGFAMRHVSDKKEEREKVLGRNSIKIALTGSVVRKIYVWIRNLSWLICLAANDWISPIIIIVFAWIFSFFYRELVREGIKKYLKKFE